MPRKRLDLEILYEDDDLLVIHKPSGLLVIPDRWDASKPTVVKLARAYLNTQATAKGMLSAEPPRIWVVHRLDRDTSGVLILAKSDRAHAALSQQFERGTVLKTYLALVSGQGIRGEGVIRLPIGPHPQRPGMMVIRAPSGQVRCHTLRDGRALSRLYAAGGAATNRAQPSDSRACTGDRPSVGHRPALWL